MSFEGYFRVNRKNDNFSSSMTKNFENVVEENSFLNWYIKRFVLKKSGFSGDLIRTQYDSYHWGLVLEYLVGFTVEETFFYKSQVNGRVFHTNNMPEDFKPTGEVDFVGKIEGEEIIIARILYSGRASLYSSKGDRTLSLQKVLTRYSTSGLNAIRKKYLFYDLDLDLKAGKPDPDEIQNGRWTWLGNQTIFWIPKGVQLGDRGTEINIRGQIVIPSEVLLKWST